MRIVVDPESGVAPWRQVRDQIVALVENGTLPLGTRLPAIRPLAAELGLAPGTVARAYKELEAEGILRTAGRHGTVVAELPGAGGNALRRAAEEYVATARVLGADAASVIAEVEAAVERAYPARQRPTRRLEGRVDGHRSAVAD